MDDNNQNELQEEQKCWNNCNSRRSEFYLYCTKQFHVTYHACHCSLGTIFSRGLVSSDPFFPVTQYLADDLLMWPSWCAEGSGLLMLHCYDLRGSGLPHLQHPTDTGLHHCDHLHRNIHHLEPLLLKWNSIKLYSFPIQGRGQGREEQTLKCCFQLLSCLSLIVSGMKSRFHKPTSNINKFLKSTL